MPTSGVEEHTFSSRPDNQIDRPVTPGPNAFARKRDPTPTPATSPPPRREMYIPDNRPKSRSQSRAEIRRVDPAPFNDHYGSTDYENNQGNARSQSRARSRTNSPRRPNTASTTTSSNKSARVQFALEGNQRVSPTDSKPHTSPSETTSYEEMLKLIPSPDPNKPTAPTARKSIEERKEQRLMELIRNNGSTSNSTSSGTPIATIRDAQFQRRRHVPSPLQLAPLHSETERIVDHIKAHEAISNVHIVNTNVSTRELVPPIDPSPSPKKRFMNMISLGFGGTSTLKSNTSKQELKESKSAARMKVPPKAAQLLGARVVAGDERVAPTISRWAQSPPASNPNTWASPVDGAGLGINDNIDELRREFGMSEEVKALDLSGRSHAVRMEKSSSAPRERERATDEFKAGIRNRPATVQSKTNPRAKGAGILKNDKRDANADNVQSPQSQATDGEDSQSTERSLVQHGLSDPIDNVEQLANTGRSQTSMTLNPVASLQFYDGEGPPTPPSKSATKASSSQVLGSRLSVGERLPSTTYSRPSSPSKDDRVGLGQAGYVSQAKLVETTPNAHSMCALVEGNDLVKTSGSASVASPAQMSGTNPLSNTESTSWFTPTAAGTFTGEINVGGAVASLSTCQESLVDSTDSRSPQSTPNLFPTPLKPKHLLRERRAFHSLHRHFLEQDESNGPAKKDSPITPSAGYVPLMLDPETRRKLLIEGKISPEPNAALRPSTDTLDNDEIDDVARAYIQLDVDLIRNMVRDAVYEAEVRAEESRAAKHASILFAIEGFENRIANLRAEMQAMKAELSRIQKQEKSSVDSKKAAPAASTTQKPLPIPILRGSPKRQVVAQQQSLQSPASPTSPMYSVATTAQLTGRNQRFERSPSLSPKGQLGVDFTSAEHGKFGKIQEATAPTNAGQREQKHPKRSLKGPSNGLVASGMGENENDVSFSSNSLETPQQQLRQSAAASYFAQLGRNRGTPDLSGHPAWRGY